MLIKQALAQGLLLHHPADRLPAFSTADHRSCDPQFQPSALAVLDTRLAPLRARFGDSPAELARIALRYALQRPTNSTSACRVDALPGSVHQWFLCALAS